MKIIIQILIIIFIGNMAIAQKLDRSTPPPLGKVKNLQLPPIQKFKLTNGVNVVLMEKHNVPMVQMGMLMKMGSVNDPAGKEGLASFAMDMLDEGAGNMDALQLADETEYLGSQIRTYGSTFTSGISANMPVSKLDQTLKIMADILIRPKLATDDIERGRKLRLSGLLSSFDEPSAISRQAFDRLMFGTKSIYGRSPNEASIKSVSQVDLKAFHKKYFVASNMTIIIVGDVTKMSITPLLEKHLRTIPKGVVSPQVLPIPEQVKGREIYIVDKPGAAQSVIRIGKIGTKRNTAEENAIVVMNTILGGSFASRLNTNLREEHGYSYGASSNFSFWPVPGPFLAASSVQTDVTGPALGEFFIEFENMLTSIPEEDISRGKNYDALGYAGNFESNANIVSNLSDMIAYQLPDNHFNTYIDKVLSVTKEQVDQVAKKYITPDNMLIVIVGDREIIQPQIEKLKLGTIKNLTIEEVMGKKPAF